MRITFHSAFAHRDRFETFPTLVHGCPVHPRADARSSFLPRGEKGAPCGVTPAWGHLERHSRQDLVRRRQTANRTVVDIVGAGRPDHRSISGHHVSPFSRTDFPFGGDRTRANVTNIRSPLAPSFRQRRSPPAAPIARPCRAERRSYRVMVSARIIYSIELHMNVRHDTF